MTIISWTARLATLFRRRQLDERLEEELQFHLEMASQELEQRGVSRDQAKRTARLALAPGGALERVRENHRAQRGVPMLEHLGQDLRFAFRTMGRSTGFTVVALLSLALGIGTNSAIFSVVDALLLRPLPIPQADHLVVISRTVDNQPSGLFSYPAFRLLQGAKQLAGVVAISDDFTAVVRAAATQSAEGPAETAESQLVSGNLFATLGIHAIAGRTFTADEDTQPGAQAVAVISYGFWQKRFGRNPGIVGQSLDVNSAPVTVLGVLPEGFRGLLADAAPDVFLPLTLRDTVRYSGSMTIGGPENPRQPVWQEANQNWLRLLAKRQPSVSIERAGALLAVLFEREKQVETIGRIDAAGRDRLLAERLVLESGERGIADSRETLTRPLLILAVLASLVLLIACTNVATLLLARADRRRKEMAVRLGVGAARARIIRQLLTESVLLAALGAGLGLLLATWGSRLLVGLMSAEGTPWSVDPTLDGPQLAFAVALALTTGVAFGLAPALLGTRVDLASSLSQGARSVKGGRNGQRLPLGRILVGLQVALSLVLLIGAGLFAQSLRNLVRVDPGYHSSGLLLARVDPALLSQRDGNLIAFYDRLTARLEAIPGIRSAGLSRARLLTDESDSGKLALTTYAPAPHESMNVQHTTVTPHYFATVGLDLVEGRSFDLRDRVGSASVAIVNEALVRRYLPHGPALGQRLGFGGPDHARDLEIVGVVKDGKYHALSEPTRPLVYLPVTQIPPRMHEANVLRDLEVRIDLAAAPGGLSQVAGELQRAVAGVAPGLPVLSVTTMGEQVARSLSRERAIAHLTAFFGVLAVVLAAVGLYGVISYGVSRRSGEIGLRMALGASRSTVVGLVLRETLLVTAGGLVIGLLATAALTHLASHQLFQISAHDPLTLLGASLLLAVVALAASSLPGWRAASVRPVEALRAD
jgi:predicted permease